MSFLIDWLYELTIVLTFEKFWQSLVAASRGAGGGLGEGQEGVVEERKIYCARAMETPRKIANRLGIVTVIIYGKYLKI